MRRAAGLGRHLLWLGLLVVAPLLAAAAVTIGLLVANYREDFRSAREDTAVAVATAIAAEIDRVKPMLRALSEVHLLSGQPSYAALGDLHERMTRHARAFGTEIWAEQADGAWRIATARPFDGVRGREGPVPPQILEARARAAASGDAELADLGTGMLPDGAPAAAVSMPVLRDGRIVAWMGAAVLPGRLAALLSAQPLPAGETISLVDGAGRVVARAPDHDRHLGLAIPDWFAQARGATPGGTLSGANIAGQRTVLSFAEVPGAPGWLVALGTPEARYLASWQRPLRVFGGAAVGTLLLTAVGAGLAARRLLRPLQAVTAGAAAVASGGGAPPRLAPGEGARVAEFEQLGAAVVQAEELLRAQARAARQGEALLRSILDSAGEAIAVKDLEGRYRVANPAAARLRGQEVAAMLGRSDAELGLALPPAVAAAERAALVEGRGGIVEERRPAEAPGTDERVLLTAMAPWRDPETGALLGAIALTLDISERLAAERRLREADRHLQALTRKAAASALATGIAHEVSQPLSAAANLLHVARRSLDGAPETGLRDLADAQAQVLRAGEILRGIRAFLAGGPGPAPAPAAIGPLVEQAVRLATGDGVPKDLVTLRIEDKLPAVPVVAVQVEQVVVNLVRNAVEALDGLPPDAPRRVEVSVERDGGGVAVSVTDTGPGLAPEVAARPFEALASAKTAGSGLGLAICRTLVEAQGGRITIGPGPAGGTLARVALPGTAT